MPHPSFSVPSPCTQSWDAMTPTAHGRHCAACAKVVVDFTRFTDAELLAWLRQQAGQSACGRFRADQLGRALRPAAFATQPKRWRTWLAAVVAVWGLREAAATAAKAQVPTEQREPEGTPISIADWARKPVVIRGVVSDSTSHELLPGVTVLLGGTNLGASTDTAGQFELVIPAEAWAASKKQLTVTTIGFVKKEIPLSTSPTQSFSVALAADVMGLMGEVVIIDIDRPWYNPRNLWQRLKRPFRH
ncbi:carboxypeptidase-like regulatory domain-containing protein [Hymenobacter cavernae]|uniref:Carboxypeptidase-like regulatory domain-containing protein n=1 Tax=Hymenobacter cavernae TaxID=2044852 RepID=A0ABQ1TUS1_9BACT|nr:carboxypeptidase-like regulatory domain-containing protein [Hymenobacter cavernae]GGF04026.1 hypothetical protein GCM10011383_13880 [Hymenobacter cavernae]